MGPNEYKETIKSLDENGIEHRVLVEDIGAMERELERLIALRRVAHQQSTGGKAFDFEDYHPYAEVRRVVKDNRSTVTF